ncbi:hypothetical protein L9F63_013227, partial [Diploptera punctata]
FPITAKCAALAPPSVSCLIHYMFPYVATISNVFHVLCYALNRSHELHILQIISLLYFSQINTLFTIIHMFG